MVTPPIYEEQGDAIGTTSHVPSPPFTLFSRPFYAALNPNAEAQRGDLLVENLGQWPLLLLFFLNSSKIYVTVHI